MRERKGKGIRISEKIVGNKGFVHVREVGEAPRLMEPQKKPTSYWYTELYFTLALADMPVNMDNMVARKR